MTLFPATNQIVLFQHLIQDSVEAANLNLNTFPHQLLVNIITIRLPVTEDLQDGSLEVLASHVTYPSAYVYFSAIATCPYYTIRLERVDRIIVNRLLGV